MKFIIIVAYVLSWGICILGFRRKIADNWKLLLSLLCVAFIPAIAITVRPSLPTYGPLNELAPISATILLSMLTLEIAFILYAIKMVVLTVIRLRNSAQQAVAGYGPQAGAMHTPQHATNASRQPVGRRQTPDVGHQR
jgi:hypothetical protein